MPDIFFANKTNSKKLANWTSSNFGQEILTGKTFSPALLLTFWEIFENFRDFWKLSSNQGLEKLENPWLNQWNQTKSGSSFRDLHFLIYSRNFKMVNMNRKSFHAFLCNVRRSVNSFTILPCQRLWSGFMKLFFIFEKSKTDGGDYFLQ